MKNTQFDPADAVENARELLGDRTAAAQDFSSEEAGYHKTLKPRQIQMIAIGGAIGTGLFMGAGGRLNASGPALILVYAICGFFAFLILRALGELVLHRPSSGSFVSYAREFYGEKMAYAAGWLYFLNWAMTSIVDVTAVALYIKFWGQFWEPLQSIPQWLIALAALVVVLALNLVSVKIFGEMEFWFALIKVAALVAFLVVGVCFIIFGGRTDIGAPGVNIILDHGGAFPAGAVAPLLAISGVVFAYAAIELVGTAAGETAQPQKVMPKAVNTVVFRIAIFYVGSVLLLSLLLPFTAYESGESPFVTFFSHLGDPQAGAISASVMNFVVLTAALSSLNAGLYSTGRILRSMAVNGSAPQFTARISASGVPYGGILLTAVITLLGVGLNALVPSQVFEIVLEVSAIGIIGGWATIMLCHIRLQSWVRQGRVERPSFRLFGAPFTSYLTLGFLAFVLVTMGFSETGRWVLASVVVLVPLLVAGWFGSRRRILAAAEERLGHTGVFPVIAERPAQAGRRP
ncbi:amino acid permease [Arthrobacter cupressi]|uniref:L-asparagine permease n=1 Tax=Arthrobacter cupressi TaxID=1045773 RepID=A0A1G8K990_9MICC|nr:amino acid permease [Arthrobacter cupressi]NYD77294.1 L-asparagine permease [Arthrobacter cupressi]SDI40046.1 L-asparagine permease [Arthrobacter cupressi]